MQINTSITLGSGEYAGKLAGNAEELALLILNAVGANENEDTSHVLISDSGSAGVTLIAPPLPEQPTLIVVNSSYATNNVSPPGDKQTRTNATEPSDVTAMYIDNETTEGVNISLQLLALVVGDEIEIRGVNDTSRFAKFTLTAVPIEKTGFIELPVSFANSAGNLVNGPCKLTYPEKS